MAYASVDDIREYLPQVETSGATEVLLEAVLDRATKIIDTELGFAFGTAAIGTRVVYGDGTDYLLPPAFVTGSVTAITTLTGYTVPSYVEQEGMLVVKTVAGVIAPIYSYPTLTGFRGVGGWLSGVPYTVAATFGYTSVPKDIVEACLEIAVRLWRARDAGFSDVVGVSGDGEVAYTGTYPKLVGRILERYRDTRDVGVW